MREREPTKDEETSTTNDTTDNKMGVTVRTREQGHNKHKNTTGAPSQDAPRQDLTTQQRTAYREADTTVLLTRNKAIGGSEHPATTALDASSKNGDNACTHVPSKAATMKPKPNNPAPSTVCNIANLGNFKPGPNSHSRTPQTSRTRNRPATVGGTSPGPGKEGSRQPHKKLHYRPPATPTTADNHQNKKI